MAATSRGGQGLRDERLAQRYTAALGWAAQPGLDKLTRGQSEAEAAKLPSAQARACLQDALPPQAGLHVIVRVRHPQARREDAGLCTAQ